MLIFTRKKDEVVVIGDQIKITVVQIRPSRQDVLLGIDAPRETSVHRAEVWEAIRGRKKDGDSDN